MKPLKMTSRTYKTFICLYAVLFSALLVIQADVTSASGKKPRQTATYHDPGVDTVMVKTQTSLFVKPDTNAAKISSLHPGDLMVLVSREISDGWFQVIHFDSGRQGWARADRMFAPIYTHNRNPSKILSGVSLGTSDPPVIEVQNDSDIDLYLHLDRLAEVYVSPHTTRSVVVQAGIFAFNASGPKVLPDFGSMAFLPGTKYPWRFFVGSVHERRIPNAVPPAMAAEYSRLLADVRVRQAQTKIERQQLDAAKSELDKQGEKAKAEANDVDAKRLVVDHSDQNAIDAFNSLVDAANSDAATFRKIQEQFNAKVDAFNSDLDVLKAEEQHLTDMEEAINAR